VKTPAPRVIKVCGLTRAEDVTVCVDAGVDAVGFNFYPRSPRYVRPEIATALIARVPSSVLPVGVFVGASPEEVGRIAAATGIRAIQLHGDEDPAAYAPLSLRVIQVVRVRAGEGLPESFSPAAHTVLLDSFVSSFGGEGRPFDWNLLQSARERIGRPWWVAGGITPQNVQELLAQVHPDGVDVASGVESALGIKDPVRVRALVAAVRGWRSD
jgi:phosphoribosylanthranilate isomerase